ncbi:DUF3955 domain-containing protein [Bacillus sp. FJAT-49705]|uniref:DUF3955 domain-containing protein n=1 Tax=Cytobacillus citreus TaxID=2833586 RepID=A0ABS5NNU5_9BACI|nr:DUF3955 domain-containing protein [Cytobacillus citreus]MBS4189492.1 DUF3955 domain-containing protein [Cytobacillus citreus]
MKNKYLLASTPIFLGVICLIITSMTESTVAPDGMLNEPYFFLIPVSYILFFIGIISFLFMSMISMFKKKNIAK